MIVHDTAIHRLTQIKTSKGPITAFSNEPELIPLMEVVKGLEIQNVKLFLKHNNQHNLLKKW